MELSILFVSILFQALGVQSAAKTQEIVARKVNAGEEKTQSLSYHRQFVSRAVAYGTSIDNGLTKAYFIGSGLQNQCFTTSAAIACMVSGPQKALYQYGNISNFYNIKEGEVAYCYAGQFGIFCNEE